MPLGADFAHNSSTTGRHPQLFHLLAPLGRIWNLISVIFIHISTKKGPDFGRSVNPMPISTRGDRLCPPNYYWHPRIFRPSDGPGMYVLTYSEYSSGHAGTYFSDQHRELYCLENVSLFLDVMANEKWKKEYSS